MAGPANARTWGKRAAVGAAAVLLIGGAYTGMNWSALKAGWAAAELRDAGSDEARAVAAAKLVALGDPGVPRIVEVLQSDDAAACLALAAAVRESLAGTPPTDAAFSARCRPLLADAGSYSECGKDAILGLAADAVKGPDADLAARGREVIRAGLAAASVETVARAVTVAAEPDVNLRAEVVPLLGDARVDVRRAAMRAVGPAGHGDAVIGDEELFRWLNDADLEVRAVCESALLTRGLDGDQIAAARKLTHPEASERLKLLLDLRWGRDTIRDPGPWLERLSRDPEPAVRAGAARVACECQLNFAGWVDRLAGDDPEDTVRRVAGFYKAWASEVKRAGHQDR